MPDSYGNAKDFFDKTISDSAYNTKSGLMQFSNGSCTQPQVDDLVVFDGNIFNKYGHVAIVADVTDSYDTIIQQNPGPYGQSRDTFNLEYADNTWTIKKYNTLGWLRMP